MSDSTSAKASKPTQLPWETEPYVNPVVAKKRALDAARPRTVNKNSAAVKAWATEALNKEIDALVRANERNNQLFISAAALYEIVAAGALSETEVYDALREACRANGYEQSDGEHAVEATIKSGRRHGMDSPRDLSHVGKNTGFHHYVTDDDPEPKKIDLDDVFDLERGFWTKRPSLQHIYLAALSRMCAPWAVLGYTTAMVLAGVPPHCTLPPTIAGPGTLNWFCAITGESGGGKSGAGSVAKELVKHHVRQKNLGSGEGIVDAYIRPANKETGEPKGRYDSVMFLADEIDMLRALAGRSGTTLVPALLSAFSASTPLGFSNRTASDLHLEPHTYRMTLVANVQPARADTLMDAQNGILQRFMWFPSKDSRVTDEPPEWPGELDITPPSKWRYPTKLEIPYEATALIRDNRARQMRGETDDVAGHALYIREKFAYALAIIDGRDKMTAEDWALAGTASRVSDFTRGWVYQELRATRGREDIERGQRQGETQLAANETRTVQEAIRSKRAYDKAYDRIKQAGDDGITNRELTRNIDSKLTAYLRPALVRLTTEGLIEKDERPTKTGTSVVWKVKKDNATGQGIPAEEDDMQFKK